MSIELGDSYESLFEEALHHRALGDMQGAIDLLLRIVNRLSRLRPETLERNPDRCELLLDAWDDAIDLLRLKPDLDKALQVCQQFHQRHPEIKEIAVRIATLMIEKGEVDKGLERLQQLAQDNPDMLPFASLAIELRGLGRYQEAQTYYQQAIELAQNNKEAAWGHYQLHLLYLEIEQVKDALDAWQMSVVLDPDRIDRIAELCRWLIDHGEFEHAQQYLERDPDVQRRRFYQGLLDWHTGRENQARTAWQQTFDLNETDRKPNIGEWMEAAVRLDKPQAVVDWIDDQNPHQLPSGTLFLLLVAAAHAKLGEQKEAEFHLERLITRLKLGLPSQNKIKDPLTNLFVQLVSDETILRPLAKYFEGEHFPEGENTF